METNRAPIGCRSGLSRPDTHDQTHAVWRGVSISPLNPDQGPSLDVLLIFFFFFQTLVNVPEKMLGSRLSEPLIIHQFRKDGFVALHALNE